MRKSTLFIISILAMLLLAGSLMGWTYTMHTDTNRDCFAYIEIREYPSGDFVKRIPTGEDYFDIYTTSNNTQYAEDLNPVNAYTATIFAHRTVGGVVYSDTESVQFGYNYPPHTFHVDISGNKPNDPPVQD